MSEGLMKPITKLTEEEYAQQVAIRKKSPEQKQYIILQISNESSEERTFFVTTGRSQMRSYIIENIEEIDIHKSMVLVEDVAFEDSINVYNFMAYIADEYRDEFNIEDYNYGEPTDESSEGAAPLGAVQM
jgi:hypothetical protein